MTELETPAERRARQQAIAIEGAQEAITEAQRLVSLADRAVRLAARISTLPPVEASVVPVEGVGVSRAFLDDLSGPKSPLEWALGCKPLPY